MAARTLVADPISPLGGRDPLRLTLDAHGRTLLLALDAPGDVPPESWGPGILRMRTARPHRYRVSEIDDAGAEVALLATPPLDERFTDVQRLPGGRFLLVRGRAAGPDDPNATVLAPDGTVERRFHVGDAIAHLQADAHGAVWAGYFDEGVFGPSPPGDAGLVRFTPTGEVAFRFNDRPGPVPIDSCYALNVAAPGEAWAYYWSAFHLVRIHGDEVAGTWPDLPIRGFSAFATDGRRLLVAGGYQQEDRFFLLDLVAGGPAEEVQAVSPDGEPLTSGPAQGRGGRLYFRDRGWWWRLDLARL